MKYARINNNKELEILADPNPSEALIEEIVAEGYMPYKCEPKPDVSGLSPIEGYKLHYRQEDGCIVGYYKTAEVNPKKVEAEIARLKGEIASTDYRVTKNQELQMIGQACVYDPKTLHDEREALREAIRKLEVYIA